MLYFDGYVASRAVTFADGINKILGVMMPAEYTFGTEKTELMDIMVDELTYCIDIVEVDGY